MPPEDLYFLAAYFTAICCQTTCAPACLPLHPEELHTLYIRQVLHKEVSRNIRQDSHLSISITSRRSSPVHGQILESHEPPIIIAQSSTCSHVGYPTTFPGRWKLNVELQRYREIMQMTMSGLFRFKPELQVPKRLGRLQSRTTVSRTPYCLLFGA